MNESEWFDYQLSSTLDGFLWAVRQVPEERITVPPPAPLGEWTATQHVYHLVQYEEKLALPAMQQWLGAPFREVEDYEGEVGRDLPPVADLLARFEQVRKAEIGLLPQLANCDWRATRKTSWGDTSLYWIVCKTYQHTLDHTNTVLAFGLFWDRMLKYQAQEQNQSNPA